MNCLCRAAIANRFRDRQVLVVPCAKIVVQRRDAVGSPDRILSAGGESKTPVPVVRRQPSGEIAHYHVIVAVANKEHGVGREQMQQKPGCPAIGQISFPEVAVGKHDPAGRQGGGTMQKNDPLEVVPERKSRRGMDRNVQSQSPRSRGKVRIEVGGYKADRTPPEQLQQERMKLRGLRVRLQEDAGSKLVDLDSPAIIV